MWWGAIIAAVASIITTVIAGEQQKSANKDAFNAQFDAQKKLIADQNAYNTPANQMARLQAGGLNPHLMYGQGSPGNQPSAGSAPAMAAVDYLGMGEKVSNTISNTLPLINQTRLAESQVNATNAATSQRYAQTRLTELQSQVMAKNPLLDDAGFKATIDGLKASAQLKQTQVRSNDIKNFVDDSTATSKIDMIWKEAENIDQKFRLRDLDAKIKAEVMKSKEFQNAILEVQKKFMTDADITPQHILQFVQLILMKAL